MSTRDTTAGPVLPLVDTPEERMIRETVRRSARGSAPTTRASAAPPASRRPSSGTRWRAAATSASTSPRSAAAAGSGMSALSAVGEEISAAGMLAAADRGLAGDRRQHPRPPRHARAEGPLAARHRRGHDQGRVRDHRARRRHQLPQPRDRRSSADGDRFVLRGAEDLHLGRRGRRRGARRGPQPRRRRRRSACRSLVHRRRRRPGLHARRQIPMPYVGPDKQWTLFFDDVELDGGAPDRRRGRRARRRSSTGSTRSASWAPRSPAGAGRRALEQGVRLRERARRLGRSRSAPTRAIAHPLAEAKIELELARLMTQKAAALYDAGAPRARARPATWPSTPPPRRRSTAWTGRSRPTAATASRSSTGSPTCGGACA